MAADVINNGANCGFSGFIYYSETAPFAVANKADIMAYAKEMAADLGHDGAYSMIAGFNCFRNDGYVADHIIEAINDPDDENHTHVMNALAWFALEEVARSYCDLIEG